MFKISTKGRYGVRFLLDLMVYGGERAVPLREVAKRQGVSEKYLWQVIHPLKKAGLVHAEVGSRGGYRLAVGAGQSTLQDILVALEGRSSLVDCVSSPKACDRSAACAVREVWQELDEKIAQALDAVTLNDMAEKHRVKTEPPPLSYTI